MIQFIKRLVRHVTAAWRATDPQYPLQITLDPEVRAALIQRIRLYGRQGKPQQIAPKVFDGDGYVSFHRHSDGLPVAIARAKAFVSPPEGCYAAPLANGDVSLYRCTLPELHPTT